MGRWQPDARARLQAAALALYGERGYEQTTVAEIAERAGLTKRTFFRYFTDKREVLFWGSELLEQQMVAAIEAAPASASALGMIGAALDAAAVRFEEVREFAGPRHRIIASSPELQERELIKAASLAAAMARGTARPGTRRHRRRPRRLDGHDHHARRLRAMGRTTRTSTPFSADRPGRPRAAQGHRRDRLTRPRSRPDARHGHKTAIRTSPFRGPPVSASARGRRRSHGRSKVTSREVPHPLEAPPGAPPEAPPGALPGGSAGGSGRGFRRGASAGGASADELPNGARRGGCRRLPRGCGPGCRRGCRAGSA